MFYSLKRSRYLVDQGYNYEVVPYDCPVQMLGEEPRWNFAKGARSALDADGVSPQWLAHGIAEMDQRKTLLQILASDQNGSADEEIQISVKVRTRAMDAPSAAAGPAAGKKKAKAKGSSVRRKRTLDQMSGAGGLLYGEHANSAKAAMEMQRKMKKKKREAKKLRIRCSSGSRKS